MPSNTYTPLEPVPLHSSVAAKWFSVAEVVYAWGDKRTQQQDRRVMVAMSRLRYTPHAAAAATEQPARAAPTAAVVPPPPAVADKPQQQPVKRSVVNEVWPLPRRPQPTAATAQQTEQQEQAVPVEPKAKKPFSFRQRLQEKYGPVKQQEQGEVREHFAVGEQAVHPLFGLGTVVDEEDMSGLQHVKFGNRVKWLNTKYAKLRRTPSAALDRKKVAA